MADAPDPLSGPKMDCRIGDWIFHPGGNELRRPDTRRRLEHRAARTLELLCRHRGEIVSRRQIVEAVWEGRAVSPNSVSIVISDLREALGDDARSPRHIETVAKLGYRLLCGHESHRPALARTVSRRGKAIVAVLLALAFGLAIVMGLAGPARPPVTLIVADVVNETGDPAMDALARASTQVMLGAADRETSAAIVSPTGGPFPKKNGHQLSLTGRLVMWSGKPTLMMSATNPVTGEIVWNGKSRGGEDSIPRDVASAMRDLGGKLD